MITTFTFSEGGGLTKVPSKWIFQPTSKAKVLAVGQLPIHYTYSASIVTKTAQFHPLV